jgi:hypothetical protein
MTAHHMYVIMLVCTRLVDILYHRRVNSSITIEHKSVEKFIKMCYNIKGNSMQMLGNVTKKIQY